MSFRLCPCSYTTRTHPLDMGAFVINLKVILSHDVWFTQNSKPGHSESDFLSKININLDSFEVKANCSKVYILKYLNFYI